LQPSLTIDSATTINYVTDTEGPFAALLLASTTTAWPSHNAKQFFCDLEPGARKALNFVRCLFAYLQLCAVLVDKPLKVNRLTNALIQS
jgi:hypothetical protein